MSQQSRRLERFQGLVVGTAVGDALGLPREGLSARRARRMLGAVDRHAFVFGHGMVSDDTEHSIFVAQSLIRHPRDARRFQRRLAWSLRWWLLTLPAGIGLATLRAILRSWIGFPPDRAGVRSAGNGAAMRAAPIGAFFFDDAETMSEYVRAASRLTHTDPRAEIGARAVALLAAFGLRRDSSKRPSEAEFLQLLRDANLGDAEWDEIVSAIERAIAGQRTVAEFASSIGQHDYVSGYVYHTVPVVVYAWFVHHGDFRAALVSVLNCGGDADTTGAIIGALAGCSAGVSAIPVEWIEGVAEYPRSISVCREIGRRLDRVARSREPGRPVGYFWPGVLVRNPVYLVLVLVHGLRRLCPPY